MVWAADAVSNPSPAALKMSGCAFIGRYVGTAYQRYGVSRSYIDDCLAHGVGVLLIFEEWASQFLSGRSGAAACCDRMMAGWDALGAPSDGSVLPAVVMLDPSPSVIYGAEPQMREWSRGWQEHLPLPGFMGYGSRYSLDVAAQTAPKMIRRWGVRTWGYQDGPPPDLIQEPNIAPPIGGVDYNTIVRADLGVWGGQSAGAREDDPMSERLVENQDNGEWWYFPPLAQPPVKVSNEEVLGLGSTGIPVSHSRGPAIVAAGTRRASASAAFQAGLLAGSGATEAQVQAAVRAELNATRLASP